MEFPRKIFKAYDIRGLVSGELSPELAYRVGRSFAVFLKNKYGDLKGKGVVVGRDMRETSPLFAQKVTEGIMDEGLSVVDVGLVSTPLFNFGCAHYPEHAGGIMVTASHNPAQFNGFKMTLSDGLPIGRDNGMNEIRDVAEKNVFTDAAVKGKKTERSILEDYLERIFSLVDPVGIKPLKIVVDAGNGMAKATIPHILERLPVKVEYLYLEPDGNFPNHESNPIKTETLRDLQKKVLELGADFGFATDGDADRIGLVNEKGEVVGASFAAALLGMEVLKKHPGGMMFYDLRSSMILKESWENAGARTEMCPVGHALIKKMMKEKGGIFASELSLHLYYHDMYDVESSDLSLMYILQLLSRENKPLTELIAPLQKYFHSGEINFEVENKEEIMQKIEERYAGEAKNISHLDGLWMGFDWGWLNVRASNTEPVLRLNLEARDSEMTRIKVEEVKSMIER